MELDTKRELIRELDRFAANGTILSFRPTEQHTEEELSHELARHVANDTILQRVAFMKVIIKVGVCVLEMVLKRWLKLKGWSTYISRELDSGKHNATLEQVYRTIWKRGTPNPWLGLVTLIVGSGIGFHCGFLSAGGSGGGDEGGGGGGGGGGSGTGGGGGGGEPGKVTSEVFGQDVDEAELADARRVDELAAAGQPVQRRDRRRVAPDAVGL